MADFYQLGDEDKALAFTKLAERALVAWGLTGAELSLLKQRENAVFEVVTDEGDHYALRIHRHDYHSDAELTSEIAWMRALKRSGFQTGDVIPALDGDDFKTVEVEAVPEPRQVDLLEWIHGAPIGGIEDSVEDVELACRNYRVVGEIVARMHDFSVSWPLPDGFQRHAWDEVGLLGEEPFWGRFWELDSLSRAQRAVLRTAVTEARKELEDYGMGQDRYGLIHADTLPENFLRTDDGEIWAIDFDDGGFGWLLFDFATAMFFHLGEPYFDDLLAAFIVGYEQVRQLPPEFEELRGMTYLGWAHTRRDTDTAKELTPVIVPAVMELADDYLNMASAS